jgi:hypothetical protein
MSRKKTLTDHYTNTMRTGAVTVGHAAGLAGAALRQAPCPVARSAGKSLERAGDAVARKAVDQCSRDTPSLKQCNDD